MHHRGGRRRNRAGSPCARTHGTTGCRSRGYAGPAADREHQRVAVSPRQDRRARRDPGGTGAPDRRVDRLRERRRRPGRAGLRRGLDGGGARRRGASSRRDVRRGPADRRPARRGLVRRRPARVADRRRRRSTARWSLGLGDYVRKNGFREVVAGAERGHRLGAHRHAGRRRARRRRRARGSPCRRRSPHPRAWRTPSTCAEAARASASTPCRSRRCSTPTGHSLAELFAGQPEDVTEENLQARVRGNLLMALSNKFGSMVLATGNKSEYAVGYSTLYGDMAGGFAPIKDVPEDAWCTSWRPGGTPQPGETAPIPERTITKPPSAELRPDQKDTDSLPALRRARPDHRGLRGVRPGDRRHGRRRVRTRRSSNASWR